MIPVSDLIALFARMYREHWAYEWGAAREGCVDCSGAFVWAYRQLGHSIYHGSNTIARRHVGPMTQMPAPGYAAFKWRKKDTSKFPDGRGDYYHIGLVDETGEWVYEARSARAGFTRSRVSVWHSFAPLLAVDYGDEGGTDMESEIQYEGVVVTKSGGLNLRSGPGTGYPIIRVLPKGTLVGVMMEPLEGWLFVRTGENTGYVSAKYIAVPLAPHPETEAESAQDGEQTSSDASGDTFPSPGWHPGTDGAGSVPKGEGLDGTAVKWGVFAPCDSREEAEALQKAHKGAILTCYNLASYKPPDGGGD